MRENQGIWDTSGVRAARLRDVQVEKACPDETKIPSADLTAYEKLGQQEQRRDGWRCQSCGTLSNLEVHHKEFRSRLGDDSEGT